MEDGMSERERWCLEKVEFVTSVVKDVSRDVVWSKISKYHTNKEVSVFVQKLLKYDQEEGYYDEPLEKNEAVVGFKQNTDSYLANDHEINPTDDNENLELRLFKQVFSLSEMFPNADHDYLER
ncbi:hypothetical protein SK128_024530, partial [Halocaridina rubra]